MNRALGERVRVRAGSLCEYCRLPQAATRRRFHIEHIVARQHGGPTTPENLAFCCQDCNLHKGPNLSGLDHGSGRLVPLFHPRRDRWAEHFAWRGAVLVGLTPVGRVTIRVLDINNPIRVLIRASLMAEGRLPPAA